MQECRYWAIVPAAGKGSRMQASEPKQYLRVAGKTIIEHTLERLLDLDFLEGIVVVINPQDAEFRRLRIAHHPQIYPVEGGAERCDSVLNGLNFLSDRIGPDDWVLVHDAARPCVRSADIQRLVNTTREHPVGGILGVTACDTLKRVSADGLIEATVDRQQLWHAQTPQAFRYGVMQESLTRALAQGFTVTDEASALEQCGLVPVMVEGHRDNIKVTLTEDLSMADLILRIQAHQGYGVQQVDLDSIFIQN